MDQNQTNQTTDQEPVAQFPVIYVRDSKGNIVTDEKGQPLKADPTFTHAVVDAVRAMVKPECLK